MEVYLLLETAHNESFFLFRLLWSIVLRSISEGKEHPISQLYLASVINLMSCERLKDGLSHSLNQIQSSLSVIPFLQTPKYEYIWIYTPFCFSLSTQNISGSLYAASFLESKPTVINLRFIILSALFLKCPLLHWITRLYFIGDDDDFLSKLHFLSYHTGWPSP